MWVFTNKAFFSIVAPKLNDPAITSIFNGMTHGDVAKQFLLVRARRAGQIEAVFPAVEVIRVDHRDYRYRALVERHIVAEQFGKQAGAITYTNFKDSIRDRELHDMAADVWSVHHRYQMREREAPRLTYPEHKGFTRAKGAKPVLRGNSGKGRR